MYILFFILNLIITLCLLFFIIDTIKKRNLFEKIYSESSNAIYEDKNFKIRLLFLISFFIIISIITVVSFFFKSSQNSVVVFIYLPCIILSSNQNVFAFSDKHFTTQRKLKSYEYSDLRYIKIDNAKNSSLLKLTLIFNDYNINSTYILVKKTMFNELCELLKSKNVELKHNI